MKALTILKELRAHSGKANTTGLSESVIKEILSTDSSLEQAIASADKVFQSLSDSQKTLLKEPEQKLLTDLQEGILNFYALDCVSTYVPLAAKGPWIVSAYGAVVYDTGGYGMLGFGHNPDFVKDIFDAHVVMANVMTPSLYHRELVDMLRSRIGATRTDGCPYQEFICMNSGSESVSVATRLSDINARIKTDPGGAHEGRDIRFVALEKSFHGRTHRPSTASDSTTKKCQVLASFRGREFTWAVAPNDVAGLKNAFKRAESEQIFIESVIMEPVMGEGNPGLMITPEFYQTARELTKAHGAYLIVDSIQAGLRTQGVLSIVDYPGFESLDAPDMETFSKAINAGQYPLSILAMRKEVASQYKPGVYGNTMTANPRACCFAIEVLKQCTPEVQQNIRDRGKELLSLFSDMKARYPDVIRGIQGTGLLLSIELHENIKVYGRDSVEESLRKAGLNVIHGGKNALRYTPSFVMTSAEAKLIASETERALKEVQSFLMAS